MNNGLVKVAHGVGGLLVLIGAALRFFEFDWAKYLFAAGALTLIGVQSVYLQQVGSRASVRMQRMVRLLFFVTLLLGVGAYLMFTGDDRWVILLLIYALVSLFLALRSKGAE